MIVKCCREGSTQKLKRNHCISGRLAHSGSVLAISIHSPHPRWYPDFAEIAPDETRELFFLVIRKPGFQSPEILVIIMIPTNFSTRSGSQK
jgi:hypothetical protein